MPMYNLIEYSDNYSKTSGTLYQYCRNVPAVDNDGATIDFTQANVTDSFNLKVNTQVSKIRKAFANGSSANIKFSKTQLSKKIHSGGTIGSAYAIAAIKGQLSVPEFMDKKLKNILKNKDKISNTIKTVDSSTQGLKKLFGAGIVLTNNEITGIMKVLRK